MTVDQVLPILLPAHQTVLEPRGLVDALVAVPVTVRHGGHGRLEAVRVVALVAAVAEEE